MNSEYLCGSIANATNSYFSRSEAHAQRMHYSILFVQANLVLLTEWNSHLCWQLNCKIVDCCWAEGGVLVIITQLCITIHANIQGSSVFRNNCRCNPAKHSGLNSKIMLKNVS